MKRRYVQSYRTDGSSSRSDTHSEVSVLRKPLRKSTSVSKRGVDARFFFFPPHLNSAVGTMHEETTHPRPSYDALTQNNQPIAPLILLLLPFRSVHAAETQTEIPQPRQQPSDSHHRPMELCIEEPAHDEREQQCEKCLQAPDQPDGRVRCS